MKLSFPTSWPYTDAGKSTVKMSDCSDNIGTAVNGVTNGWDNAGANGASGGWDSPGTNGAAGDRGNGKSNGFDDTF